MRKKIIILLVVILICLSVSACVPGDGANSNINPAGFFTGIWHGWIAPFSLIYSIFNKNIGIYEANNIGFWYNLGYYMAIISGFGGIALSRGKSSKNNSNNKK